MNQNTGTIARFKYSLDPNSDEYTVQLRDDQSRRLSTMNRHDRRAWLSRERKRAGKKQANGRG